MATEHAATANQALQALTARLAAVDFATLAPVVQQTARQRLFDTLGALVVGLHTPEGVTLRRYAELAGTAHSARSRAERCRWHVGATRATEIDDIDAGSCTTVGAVVVPTALAVAAEAHACDGGRLLTAVVAGYEAMMRLGRAIGGATLLYRGVWPTYVTAAFAAAATTAKVLHLDATTTANALGLALTRTAPVPGAALARPGFRSYALGAAAADGVDAAFAAAAGVAADAAALAAFAERLGAELDAALLGGNAEDPWLILAVDTKLWPTSRQALASVAAFVSLGVTAEQVESIERIVVRVPVAYRAMIDRAARPAQRLESMLGVQYQLALTVFAPEMLYDAVRAELPGGAALERLMAKVTVEADERLSALFPGRWGSRVTVREGGRDRTAEVLEPEGSAARPADWGGLERKYARLYAASDIRRQQGWLGALRARCERVAARSDAVDVAADLLGAVA